ncbi:hypothetical protein TIFTF001_038588 [Ficus carica]|uniref:Uncharacterized protein n=1 Tax=Ficus carica TaxID=3494 RepID=A0AA88E8D7_FICCA|nr:hypothetical protein TIFTF001_038588 [Ficus carica]
MTGFLGGTFDGLGGRGVGRQFAKTRRRWVGDDVLTGSVKEWKVKAKQRKHRGSLPSVAHDGRGINSEL